MLVFDLEVGLENLPVIPKWNTGCGGEDMIILCNISHVAWYYGDSYMKSSKNKTSDIPKVFALLTSR